MGDRETGRQVMTLLYVRQGDSETGRQVMTVLYVRQALDRSDPGVPHQESVRDINNMIRILMRRHE